MTHRAQFTGVPWMRDYFLGLVREALELVDPDPRTMLRAVSSAVDEIRAGRNPLDEGGLVGAVRVARAAGRARQVQALMSVLEGHGNVVMDDLGREHVAGQERMSRVLSQRRKIGGVTGLLHKLLGIEQKMRQYEVGEVRARRVRHRGAGARSTPCGRRRRIFRRSPSSTRTARCGSRPRRRRTRVNLSRRASATSRAGRDRRRRVQRRRRLARAARARVRRTASTCTRCTSTTACAPVPATTPRPCVAAAGAVRRAGRAWSTSTSARGPNLEARARDARYAALERVRAEVGAAAILVAHTRDDQAETVLLQMLRGSGARRAGGDGRARADPCAARCSACAAPRRTSSARGLRLAPVHDPMNDELHHRRVWLRREIIPQLERGADRDLVEVLARQAELLRDDDELLDDARGASTHPTTRPRSPRCRARSRRRVVRRWLGAAAARRRRRSSACSPSRAASGARPSCPAATASSASAAGSCASRARRRCRPPRPSRSTLPGRRPLRRRRDRGLDRARRRRSAWPDGRSRAVVRRRPGAGSVDGPRRATPGERFRPLGPERIEARARRARRSGRRREPRARPIVRRCVARAAGRRVWVVGYRIDHRVRVTTRYPALPLAERRAC